MALFMSISVDARYDGWLELIAENGCLSGFRVLTQTLMRLIGIFNQKKRRGWVIAGQSGSVERGG